ncbi:MAG: phosphomannomutase/phosphoglucomutase [Chloroflexi bacterium]|nr:phosphomannomutase/phosphoglucomutase [Chloroflexota bacterium]
MRITPGIFKAYDIRGIYPTELDEPGAHAIGRAFVTLLGARRVIVGHDMRLSGPALFAEVTRGIMEQGADVINIGLVSTDQFYFACARLGLPGMMVTASHNPKHYNGFKMVRQMPYLLSGNEGIHDLRRIIEADAFAPSSGQGAMSALDLSEAFIETLLGMIDVAALAGRGLTVVADTGNGTVGPILRRLYARLPVTLIGLYLEPDGNLPNHGLDPLQPENRAELERRVITAGAAAGFAFDGDGDRFFAIDDRGRFVPGDFMTALLGRYLLRRRPRSKIVYDVRASWAVRDLISASGGTPLVERVGHAFIKRRMADEGALFGGEVTGHYYFQDFTYADSGLIPSLLILEMLATGGHPLSRLLEPIESHYILSGEINSTVADPSGRLEALKARYHDGVIETLDGVSVTYPDWHFNVRASNTEPLVRLNLEALSRETMEQRRDEVLAIIRA